MIKNVKSKCKLCDKIRELKVSHIIPKFVGRWLKETSGTGYLNAINSLGESERTQDLFKIPLLCSECENRINKFETFFANTIFYPQKENKSFSIPIDERIGKFAISVSLRAIWVLLNNKDTIALKWKDYLFTLEKEWKDYLLDTPNFVKGSNTHHIIFHSKKLMAAGLENCPNLILHLMRSSAFYIYEKFEKAYVSSHMAGIQIISMIEPNKLPMSKGTKVYPEQEFGKGKPGIGWGGYFHNLMDFAKDCEKALSCSRSGQIEMVRKTIKKTKRNLFYLKITKY